MDLTKGGYFFFFFNDINNSAEESFAADCCRLPLHKFYKWVVVRFLYGKNSTLSDQWNSIFNKIVNFRIYFYGEL